MNGRDDSLLATIRALSPIKQAFLVGAAAGCVFGVFAAALFYMLGQYRGEGGPSFIVFMAACWGAVVVGPMERRFGERGALRALVLALAVTLVLLPISTGGFENAVAGFLKEPFSSLIWTATLPFLSLGTSLVHTAMIRRVRGPRNE